MRKWLGRRVSKAGGNRIGRLRGYGNSIVPQLAAAFIRCFMESVLTSHYCEKAG
jgi:hypothetical protein